MAVEVDLGYRTATPEEIRDRHVCAWCALTCDGNGYGEGECLFGFQVCRNGTCNEFKPILEKE